MIGARAFLVDMAFPFIWVLIALAMVAVVLRTKKGTVKTDQVSTSKMKAKGAIAVLVLALGLANSALRLYRQVQNRSALHDLAADSVDSIQVGNNRLEKQTDVNAVVEALRNSRWYVHTAGDGGWAQTVDLVIHLRSGEERRYRVGRLLTHEGAIIDFISQDPNSQFVGHYGYAITEGLPSILERIGAPLPAEKRAGS